MMGCPVDDQYASDCLKLWGGRQGWGGPKGYPNHAAFVLRARGVPVEWNNDLEEIVGAIVIHCLDGEQRAIVKMYYEPQSDCRRNGEFRQCNMTLTLNKLNEINIKVDRNKINQSLDRAIGKVAIALSYPPAVWIEMQNQYINENIEKKVSNF